MILLDQDLDPDPARPRKAAAPATAWVRAPLPWAERLPTPRTMNRFLAEARAAVPLRGVVTVLLTTDKAIRRLNREFRGMDKATDVLSFPADPIPGMRGEELPAGDLAISVETARRQAAEQGHALTCELKVLTLHGLLHLAGYDHETDDGEMARRERALRAEFGLPQGLIERSAAGAKAPLHRNGQMYGLKRLRKNSEEAAKPRNCDVAGAEAPLDFVALAARLKPPQRRRPVAGDPGKSCPVTKPLRREIFPEPAESGPTLRSSARSRKP